MSDNFIKKNKNDDNYKGKLNPELNLLLYTFNAEANLFNYKKNEVLKVTHKTKDKCSFYCRDIYSNNINNYTKQIDIDQNSEILFKARKSINGYYELINPIFRYSNLDIDSINKLENKMWYVLPSQKGSCVFENENEPYNLSEGDIIRFGIKFYEVIKKNVNIIPSQYDKINPINKINEKFGKVLYPPLEKEVKNISKEKKQKQDDDNNEDDNDNINEDNDGFNSETDCRICYYSGTTKENPKLKLCKCKTLIHYKCLKSFLKKHIEISENSKSTVTTYKCDKFNCEVCQEIYPNKFRIKYDENEIKEYSLIDVIEPWETNFIILESLPFIEQHFNKKKIFVIKLINDKDITIGRYTQNDIIDDELTVSREHAILKYDTETGHVNIINKGTFGTQVLIKNNIRLNIDEKISIQAGITYINIEIEESKDKSNSQSSDENSEVNTTKDKTSDDINTSKAINIY